MPFVSFDPDPTNPSVGWATDDQGRQVNVSTADMPSLTTLPPSATNQTAQAPAMSTAPPAPPEPLTSMAPQPPSTAPAPSVAPARTASEVLSKLDKVPRANSGLVRSGSSTTTMAGRDPNAVASDVASVNQSVGDLSGAVTQAGDQRAARAGEAAQRGASQAVTGYFDAQAEQAAADAEMKANREQQLKLETQPDPQVDPDRYIKSMSTGKDIGLIILGALNGAFRGVAGQGGNDVVDILNKRIDQDIDVQKQAAANGRADRTNKISQLMARGHDLETAAKLAKVQAKEYAAKFYEQEAAASASTEFKEQAALDAAKLRATGAAEIRQLSQSGESRTQTTNTFARPVAAKPGDAMKAVKDALELDKMLEERGYKKDRRDSVLKAAGLTPPTGESAPARTNREQGEKFAEQKASRTDNEQKAVASFRTIQALGTEAGLTKADGKYVVENSISSRVNIPEFEEKVSGLFGGATPISNARTAALEALGRLESGGAIQKDEQQLFAEMLGKASSRRQLADTLNRIQVVIEPRLKPVDLEREKGATEIPGAWR